MTGTKSNLRFSGDKLRATRLAAGVSGESLALAVGRSFWSIHDYERGRVLPPLDVLLAISAALSADINDFLVEVAP